MQEYGSPPAEIMGALPPGIVSAHSPTRVCDLIIGNNAGARGRRVTRLG